MIEIKSKTVRAVIEELKDQYMEADKNCRPWIIGFSGGGEFCKNGPLITEKWSAKRQIVFSRPKLSYWRGQF